MLLSGSAGEPAIAGQKISTNSATAGGLFSLTAAAAASWILLAAAAADVVMPRFGSVQFKGHFAWTLDWTYGSVQRNPRTLGRTSKDRFNRFCPGNFQVQTSNHIQNAYRWTRGEVIIKGCYRRHRGACHKRTRCRDRNVVVSIRKIPGLLSLTYCTISTLGSSLVPRPCELNLFDVTVTQNLSLRTYFVTLPHLI